MWRGERRDGWLMGKRKKKEKGEEIKTRPLKRSNHNTMAGRQFSREPNIQTQRS